MTIHTLPFLLLVCIAHFHGLKVFLAHPVAPKALESDHFILHPVCKPSRDDEHDVLPANTPQTSTIPIHHPPKHPPPSTSGPIACVRRIRTPQLPQTPSRIKYQEPSAGMAWERAFSSQDDE
ncbi:hypothetical protein ARMSODRAFT_1028067 [Armillaria solidipes]|uniref:Uncharacterized protein n=1 Tax=Armillaria solidipes TaxID=1076256 RepID=A0A2H3B6N0_9AGAR|nr:hypothetical protein ARMSODRAFT_1028067 [Armillaria solidipes]